MELSKNLFVNILNRLISFPEEYDKTSRKFNATENFFGVIGCIKRIYISTLLQKK